MFLSEKQRSNFSKTALAIVILIPIVMLSIRYLWGPYIPLLVGGRAPDGNWTSSTWAPSNDTIVGTSASTSSTIWFTGYHGVIGSVFFPSIDTPNSTLQEFLVGDRAHTWVDEEVNSTEVQTQLYDPVSPKAPRSLAWITTNTARSKAYQIKKIIYTDPTRNAIIQHVTFTALKGKLADYLLYVYFDPTIHNSGDNNSSNTQEYAGRKMLITTDATRDYASALAASLPFQEDMTSSGFVHFNDGLADLKGTTNCGTEKCPDYTMNYGYQSALRGNTAQTGLLDLTNEGEINTSTQDSVSFDLVLSLGQNTGSNSATINAQKELADTLTSLAQQQLRCSPQQQDCSPQQQNTDTPGKVYSSKQLDSYIAQWHSFDDSLKSPPAIGPNATIQKARQQEYYLAINVLKASQDKQSGAFIAGLGKPWGQARGDDDIDGYHLVWARDLYQIASALILAGDTTDATKALQWLFTKQQQHDGHFPQNSFVSGDPHWTAIQMDQQAFPIMLAWKLSITDEATYTQHVKPVADFIVAHGPLTAQDRWGENGGYSPATIADEISGLICAADIAHINHDLDSEKRYLDAADNYAHNIVKWTFTTNGPLSKDGYFERIDDNGNPEKPSALTLANHGGSYDKREIVDTSFLELVRQGIFPANAAPITATLSVVDDALGQRIDGHPYWFRYNHDNYGEHMDGSDFDGNGTGRLWPLLSGERGIYEIADGGDPEPYLTAMLAATNGSGMIPEQVWDTTAPGGYQPGTPTKSMNPLNWAMAEYVTLLISASQHTVADMIPLVKERYALHYQEQKKGDKGTTPGATPTVTPTATPRP